VEIGLLDWPADQTAQLQVLDWNGAELASWNGLVAGERVSFTFPWSGELLLRLGPDDVHADANDYGLGLLCEDGCEHEGSRYPIVFMHGMAGTDSWLSLVDYWWQVPAHLEPLGYPVRTPAVDPFQTPAVRAEQWSEHLDLLYASGRARRVHLFGHSQGGLDARWLATHLDPDRRVASVTTMATPHRGSQTVDVLSGLLESSLIADDILEAMADIYASWIGLTSDQELLDQLAAMTTSGANAFNAKTPDRPDVTYASWAGITCNPLDLICSLSRDGETVFAPLITSHLTLQLLEGDNDGLVSEDSAKWGTYMGSVNADHLDEVGHLIGIPDSFDHLSFYANEAGRLADLE
jgi:triacylglycerol lipase